MFGLDVGIRRWPLSHQGRKNDERRTGNQRFSSAASHRPPEWPRYYQIGVSSDYTDEKTSVDDRFAQRPELR